MSRISYVSTLSQHIPMFCWKNLYVYNHLDVDMRFKEFAQLTEELLKYPYSIYWITMHIYIYIFSIQDIQYYLRYLWIYYLWISMDIYWITMHIYIYCIYDLSLPSSKKLLVTPSHLLPAWNLQGSPGWKSQKIHLTKQLQKCGFNHQKCDFYHEKWDGSHLDNELR